MKIFEIISTIASWELGRWCGNLLIAYLRKRKDYKKREAIFKKNFNKISKEYIDSVIVHDQQAKQIEKLLND